MDHSCVVSEILNVKNIATLNSQSRATQGHCRWYHLLELVWFPISVP